MASCTCQMNLELLCQTQMYFNALFRTKYDGSVVVRPFFLIEANKFGSVDLECQNVKMCCAPMKWQMASDNTLTSPEKQPKESACARVRANTMSVRRVINLHIFRMARCHL